MSNTKSIIFNTEMVKAILDGRKTQTRRVVGDKLLNEIYKYDCYIDDGKIFESCMCQGMPDGSGGLEVDRWEEDVTATYSKYKIGDILYVREPTQITGFTDCDALFEVVYQFLSDGKIDSLTKEDLINRYDLSSYEFETRYLSKKYMEKLQKIPNGCLKEMARIFLKVTNVRVERLQDISKEDSIKEGIGIFGENIKDNNQLYSNYLKPRKQFCSLPNVYCQDNIKRKFVNMSGLGWLKSPITSFATFWNSTAKDGYKWEDNPYVFVYEFERVENE